MAGMAVETDGNREMIKLLLKPDNMRHLFLLTLLLSFLGACTPKPVENSFVHVNANGQFIRNGKPYYYVVPISGMVPFLVLKVKEAIVNACIKNWIF